LRAPPCFARRFPRNKVFSTFPPRRGGDVG